MKAGVVLLPMSKRRGADANWFTLPFNERKALMHEHGTSGRRFTGQVLRLITGHNLSRLRAGEPTRRAGTARQPAAARRGDDAARGSHRRGPPREQWQRRGRVRAGAVTIAELASLPLQGTYQGADPGEFFARLRLVPSASSKTKFHWT